ncbi:MAG: hypothetical protein KGH58_00685 [Candidatus Micrarchaeota archaeon]|nr:hypothetical protein [Candidatus Micrarchaeota archaeon]
MGNVAAKEFRIAVIGDPMLSMGLGVSGIKRIYNAQTTEQVEAAVRDILGKSEVGMVIMNEVNMRMVRDRKLLSIMDTSISPVFIGIPSYNQKDLESDTLRRLIIRAIGIDIAKR